MLVTFEYYDIFSLAYLNFWVTKRCHTRVDYSLARPIFQHMTNALAYCVAVIHAQAVFKKIKRQILEHFKPFYFTRRICK